MGKVVEFGAAKRGRDTPRGVPVYSVTVYHSPDGEPVSAWISWPDPPENSNARIVSDLQRVGVWIEAEMGHEVAAIVRLYEGRRITAVQWSWFRGWSRRWWLAGQMWHAFRALVAPW